jgi:hypothetical protein
VEDRLAAAKRNLSIKQQQDELFGSGKGKEGQVGMTNDQTLDAAEAVHDKIEDSLVKYVCVLCFDLFKFIYIHIAMA